MNLPTLADVRAELERRRRDSPESLLRVAGILVAAGALEDAFEPGSQEHELRALLERLGFPTTREQLDASPDAFTTLSADALTTDDERTVAP